LDKTGFRRRKMRLPRRGNDLFRHPFCHIQELAPFQATGWWGHVDGGRLRREHTEVKLTRVQALLGTAPMLIVAHQLPFSDLKSAVRKRGIMLV
jgi:hypothetical protein